MLRLGFQLSKPCFRTTSALVPMTCGVCTGWWLSRWTNDNKWRKIQYASSTTVYRSRQYNVLQINTLDITQNESVHSSSQAVLVLRFNLWGGRGDRQNEVLYTCLYCRLQQKVLYDMRRCGINGLGPTLSIILSWLVTGVTIPDSGGKSPRRKR